MARWLVLSYALLAFSSLMAAPIGKVSSVKGEVFLAHELKQKQPAVAGDEIFARDKIMTGKESEVVLDLGGAATVTVGPDSYFKVADKDDKKTSLDLFSGKVQCKVDKLGKDSSFSVKTPSAVAGVRGTEFETVLDPQMNTLVAVYQGEVWNADPENTVFEPIIVNTGEVGFLMATGESAKDVLNPNVDAAAMAKIIQDNLSKGMVQNILNDKDAIMDELRQQRLAELEARISQIEERLRFLTAEVARKDLPEPPKEPMQ